MSRTGQEGFTLVELTTAITSGGILVVAFATILLMSQREASGASRRVGAQRDILSVERLVHYQLAEAAGDSLLIYADAAAEMAGTPSNSGGILTTRDVDGNTYRIATSNNRLTWELNGTSHKPMDAKVISLSFQRTNPASGTGVEIDIDFLSGGDTLTYGRILTFRN